MSDCIAVHRLRPPAYTSSCDALISAVTSLNEQTACGDLCPEVSLWQDGMIDKCVAIVRRWTRAGNYAATGAAICT
jgi:hypothetical protein